MKNKNLLIHLCLALAIIILFVLHFTSLKPATQPPASSVSLGNLSIAYVNIDSVLLHYELSQELHDEYTKNQSSYNEEYAKKRSTWEDKAARFQEKVQLGGFLTEERAMQERQLLSSEQNELMRLDQELSGKLAEMQNKNTNQLIDSLMSTIKRYNKSKKYSYILSSSSVLVGDEGADISAEILKIMNEEYTPQN